MKLRHIPHHALRARITKLVIMSSLIAYAYMGHAHGKDALWFLDRVVLLALAYGFRRALGDRYGR